MSSARARQKGVAPPAFAFDRPSLSEGDAKAKAEGASQFFRRGRQGRLDGQTCCGLVCGPVALKKMA